jgi:predicted membrane metal-binding protein
MRHRERAFGERLWRAVVIGLGVLGGFAAFDAILLFFVLLLSATFVAAPNPYLGLVVFVALPIAAIVGGAIAWTAYTVCHDRARESPAEGHQAAV